MTYMIPNSDPEHYAFRFSTTAYQLAAFDPSDPEADLGERPEYFHSEVEATAQCSAAIGSGLADRTAARLHATALHVNDWLADEGDYTWPKPDAYAGRGEMYGRVGEVWRELCCDLRLRSAAARALHHPDGNRTGYVDRVYLIHSCDDVADFAHHRPAGLLMSFFFRHYWRSPLWDLFLIDARGRRDRLRWQAFGFAEVPGSRVLGWPINQNPPSYRAVDRRVAAAGRTKGAVTA